MRYAKFFKDRDQTGISLTACYEISSVDDELAEVIYQEVHGKNLPVSEVKRIIGKLTTRSKTVSKEQIMQKVINLVHQLEDADAIEILEKCLKSLNPAILIMKNNLD
jgi:ribosomal protein S7